MKYKEWQANKTANSWKTQLRKDINQIIKITSTYTEFLAIMRAKGYEIGNDALDETGGKYITLLPVGRERVIGGKEFKKNKNMDEKKLIDSRKYFIFKIRDLVNNSFHTLEEKRMESLLQYMEICISTYDELRTSLDQTKLKRSYEGLLEGLDFQMQMHPFHKLDLYRNDFSHLHQLIILGNESRDKEIHKIHRGIVA